MWNGLVLNGYSQLNRWSKTKIKSQRTRNGNKIRVSGYSIQDLLDYYELVFFFK